MNDRDERIAQLQAKAQAQRLAAQLAMLEAREQLAPLRSVAGVVGAAVSVLAGRRRPAAVWFDSLLRAGIRRPGVLLALASAGFGAARRRPWTLLLASGFGGAVAWWLLRPSTGRGSAAMAEEREG